MIKAKDIETTCTKAPNDLSASCIILLNVSSFMANLFLTEDM